MTKITDAELHAALQKGIDKMVELGHAERFKRPDGSDAVRITPEGRKAIMQKHQPVLDYLKDH